MTQKTTRVHPISFDELNALHFIGFERGIIDAEKTPLKNLALLSFQLEPKLGYSNPLPKFYCYGC